MKKIFLLLFVSITMVSCDTNTKNQNDTSDPMSGYMVGNDAKSDAMVKFTKAYQENNISSVESIFSEDAVFHINDADVSFDDVNEAFSSRHEYFDNIQHSDYYVSTMYYNDGKIFTNYWYTWSATFVFPATFKSRANGVVQTESCKVVRCAILVRASAVYIQRRSRRTKLAHKRFIPTACAATRTQLEP